MESARLLDSHEPGLSHFAVMKHAQRIGTKRIRDLHIGKRLMALMKMVFQIYAYRAFLLHKSDIQL
jgi:hypothetical protein